MGNQRGFFAIRAFLVVPLLVIVTFALGISGWLSHGASLNDAAYRSVSLFDLGNDIYNGMNGFADWRFAVGRWTGLAAVFSAAIAAIATLLQERLALAVARWVKQEVVVIGGDRTATTAFEEARRAGRSVVWIGASALGSTSVRAIALPWPPEDQAKTVFEHAGDSDHILVAQEDDASAVALARAARRAAPRAYVTVLMRDSRLAEDAAASLNEPRTRVLSQSTVSARALNLRHPPFLIAKENGHPHIHALIVGFGQTGQAIARDLIVNCRTTFLDLPRITVIDPRARALEGVLRVRAPEIDEAAKFTFIEGEVGSGAISPEPDQIAAATAASGAITAAYVCLPVDTAALAAAGLLQSLLRAAHMGRPQVFVRLRDAAALPDAEKAQPGLGLLTAFGDMKSILLASEFLSKAPDAAARAFNEAYRASLSPEQRDDPDNRSARAWDSLDETYRQANRDVVAHIPAKLASAGVDPKYWRGVAGIPRPVGGCLFKDDAELERLAELEHERWNAQRRMDGWRWADIPAKDEARRLHPSLVTYETLSDPVKEYDRVYVRETQFACWGPATPP